MDRYRARSHTSIATSLKWVHSISTQLFTLRYIAIAKMALIHIFAIVTLRLQLQPLYVNDPLLLKMILTFAVIFPSIVPHLVMYPLVLDNYVDPLQIYQLLGFPTILMFVQYNSVID